MSTLTSLKPATPIQPLPWLLPGLLPAGELTLLDGPAGVGKSLLAAYFATLIGSDPELTKPGSVLFLSSPQQSELAIEFLANQMPNYDHIHGLHYEPDPEAISNNITMAFHVFQSIQAAILEHKPRLFIIDSLEELLEPGGETDTKTLHDLWQNLRTLAKLHHCTLLIPRKNGLHENRQYGPFTRLGSETARFALTLAWHPTDPSKRIITLAKHQRGPVGQQTHVYIKHEGRLLLTYTDPHEHVRPAKSPATWQPDPQHAQEDQEIINLVEELMMGVSQPKHEIQNQVTRAGYSQRAFKRAMSQAKLKSIRQGVDWYYFPTPQMIFRADQNRSQMNTQDSALSTQDLENPPENHARTPGAAGDHNNLQPARLTKPITPNAIRQAG